MNPPRPNRLAWLLATGGGFGAAPFMPGTVGTLAGVILAAAAAFVVPNEPLQCGLLLGLLVATCVINVAIGPWAEAWFGGKDPQAVVIDEVAGYLLTILIAPRGGPMWVWLLLGFIAFRIFDILKPPPAQRLEKLPQGWGVLCDDLAAGVYAGLVLRLGWMLWGG